MLGEFYGGSVAWSSGLYEDAKWTYTKSLSIQVETSKLMPAEKLQVVKAARV